MTFQPERLDLEELRGLPLAERIYRIRDSLGLSQAELGKLVDLDVKTVNRWENDEAEPRRKSRLALEAATGYPESLFRRKARPPVQTPEEQADLIAEIREQQDRLRALEVVVDEQGRSMTSALEALAAEVRAASTRTEPEDPPATETVGR